MMLNGKSVHKASNTECFKKCLQLENIRLTNERTSLTPSGASSTKIILNYIFFLIENVLLKNHFKYSLRTKMSH